MILRVRRPLDHNGACAEYLKERQSFFPFDIFVYLKLFRYICILLFTVFRATPFIYDNKDVKTIRVALSK